MEPSTCIEAEPYALQVTDRSMEPEFPLGCVVIVDPTGRVRDGAYVLAQRETGYEFRVLRLTTEGYQLTALRPGFPRVDLGQDLSCVVGVIVQQAGRRRRDHKHYD